ncbi:MAG: sigma-70 family RNA polymerase sigma factor [Erysipelotrichia bacterium]|jgi:RNA polymerase sigma-70 factor (ECF subfamily)|nr:sigma-70 family RNA polymerase sigma factor [Bacilli bacterium]NMV82279.1 sigma-70 family RNA polymerase sigma factor [Erysipelotrichia bacterium]
MLVKRKVILDFIARDEKAFNEVYVAYRKLLFFIIISIVKNETIAEDLLQDTFIKVYEAKETIKDPSSFHSYITLTAKNLALNELKKMRRVESLEPLIDIYGYVEQNFTLLSEIADYLSELENTIVVYKIVHERGFKEISQLTDIPLSTVYQIYQRALSKIKKRYGGKKT